MIIAETHMTGVISVAVLSSFMYSMAPCKAVEAQRREKISVAASFADSVPRV